MDDLRTSLPGWEIVRCIGSGSSGKVYEIRKKDEYGGDFHCALKVISVPGTQKEYDEMAASMDEFTMRATLRSRRSVTNTGSSAHCADTRTSSTARIR